MAIRPEQLEVTADANGGFEVIDREFYGHDMHVPRAHGSGGTLVAQRPSVDLSEVGDRVRVEPAAGSIASLVA